ncbi:hypothetical protein EG68_09650 [Paragonimus skrjabini miyazakii]|uniref:HORMA domain-containing protein n=1 Tax=Paragonimus skrjabini miyazakii TaxID=59628 RepID=A0A8S9YB87_9TREM|nr:hypothetical protein EG68_09650 [Paragonimus skrjabini miyazakii]
MAVAVASSSQIGSWSKLFPTDLATEVHSLVFVKKFFAVAVSYVLYTRRLFPESAFFDKHLEGRKRHQFFYDDVGVKLKILKEDNKFPGSSKVVYWLRGCFDAIDRQYLKAATISLFSKNLENELINNDDPYAGCKIVESYSFKMDYTNAAMYVNISSNKNGSNSQSCKLVGTSNEEIKAATISLLKTIHTAGQKLLKLPVNLYMTMRLQYYDVAPEDYVPLGFKKADDITFEFDGTPVNVRIGTVTTVCRGYFTVISSIKMHIQTNRTFLPHSKASNQTLNDVSEVSQHSVELSSQDLQDEQPTAKGDNDLGEVELTASLQKQTLQSEEEEESYDVRCPCRVNKDDGVMILCDGCGMWQHAVCFRILEEADVPTSHICEHCSESKPDLLEKGGITDSSLQGIAEDARRSICLLRRAVLLCTGLDSLSPATIAKSLDIEYTVARGLFNRLIKEGVLKETGPKRGEKLIEKDYLESTVLARVFQLSPRRSKRLPNLETMDEFISQKSTEPASSLSVRRTPRRTWAEASASNTLKNDWNNSVEDSQESLLSPAPAKKKRRTGIANTPVAVARR